MYILREILICTTLLTVLLAYPHDSSESLTTHYSNHRNYNLLPRRRKCGIQALQDRIFGGNTTNIDEFPWMGILEYQKNGIGTGFQCGGALINDKYVVTAAHCLVGKVKIVYGEIVNIRFGENDLDKEEDCVLYPDGDNVCSEPPVNIGIEERIPHDSYSALNPNKYHDIALIRLKTSVIFSTYIVPICLPLKGEKSAVGDMLTVSGWGLTEEGVRSRVKLKADIPVMSTKDCALEYHPEVVINDTQLCAGGVEGIDSCGGDSGSPLITIFPNETNFYLEGVVSFGPNPCGTKNVPGIYTRVNKYIDWILDNMKP